MADTPLKSRHLLVVDDELLIATNVEAILTGAGAEVQIANSPADALHALDTSRFDAAILDVHLENERSYDIADALIARGIPFLFLSGYLTIRAGYQQHPFIAKPFAAGAVLSGVQALLATPAAPVNRS